MKNSMKIGGLLIVLVASLCLGGVLTTVVAQDPLGSFCGIYRNFPCEGPGKFDFGGNHCSCGQRDNLIKQTLPWRPVPAPVESPPEIHRDDWYRIPSCCVEITPAVLLWSGSWVGLDFPSIASFPAELDEGLEGDPYYFTAHWETTITVRESTTALPPIQFRLRSDDDAWVFLDGELILDNGGAHSAQSPALYPASLLPGRHTIDIFYAERCDFDAVLQFGMSPIGAFVINDPFHVCAKKSFEDLLRHQEARIRSFEKLLSALPPGSIPFDLLRSLEDLIREQETLLKSFEDLLKGELPALGTPGFDSSVDRDVPNCLLEAEFLVLLASFEDLLHSQHYLIGGFVTLLDGSKTSLYGACRPNFVNLLFSLEDLIRSQSQLVGSFEDLLGTLLMHPTYTLSADQKEYFLKSFEDLLKEQSELMQRFEDLLNYWFEQSATITSQFK